MTKDCEEERETAYREGFWAGYQQRNKEIQQFYNQVMERDDAKLTKDDGDGHDGQLSFDFTGSPI